MKKKDLLAFRGVSKTRMQLAKLYAELFGLPFRVEFVEFDIEKGEYTRKVLSTNSQISVCNDLSRNLSAERDRQEKT